MVFVVFPNDLNKFSFCHKIPVSGWLACFADIAVSTSDMSLFCNRKNRKKSDGLIPNDPQYYCIGGNSEYQPLTGDHRPAAASNFTVNNLDSFFLCPQQKARLIGSNLFIS